MRQVMPHRSNIVAQDRSCKCFLGPLRRASSRALPAPRQVETLEPTSIGELISRNQQLAPLVEHWLLMKLRIEGIADMREKHALSVVFGDK